MRATGWVIGLLLVFVCEWSLAAIEVLPATERLPLTTQVHYLEDPTGIQSLVQLQTMTEHWQQNANRVFNKGFSDSAWWLRLRFHNPQPDEQQRLLEIAYPILDHVTVYVVQQGLIQQRYHTGDSLPFLSRPLISRNFVFPLNLPPQQDLAIYIKIETASSVQVPLTLWEREAFYRNQAHNNLLQGLYFGGTLTLVLYNLLIFFALRDRSYLYYVGFVASAPLFFLALSGLGFRYLWPSLPIWNAYAIPVSLSFLVIFGALFTRRFLELQRFSATLDRIIVSFVYIGVGALLISLYFPYRISIQLLAIIAIFACVADITAGLFAWRQRIASARFYVLAWSFFLLGSIIFSLNKMSLLPSNIFTENAVQVGSILEAVLLSFALADRINFERRLRFKAQEENLLAQMRANETLEVRVAERTQELDELNRRLREMSYTDPLTQLHNRRFLEEAAAKEWQRCLRKAADFSVLMLDIDHFKQVNDRFGHDTGDYCLQEVARTLRDLLRWSTDIVARYGGEEFCVVLPETDGAGAMQIAQRILAALSSMPLHTDQGDIFITVSIGVSSVKPRMDVSLHTLFTEADSALYAAKSNGRNRATLFREFGEIAMPPRAGKQKL